MSDPANPPVTPPAAPPAPAAPAEPAPPAPAPAPAPAGDGTKAALQAENEQLKARLIREAVKTAAIPHGIVEPSVLDYLPLKDVSLDKDGRVVGAENAVTHLRAERPGLFGRAPAPAPAAPAPVAAPVAPITAPQSVGAVPQPPAPHVGPTPPQSVRGLSKEEYRKVLAETRRGLMGS